MNRFTKNNTQMSIAFGLSVACALILQHFMVVRFERGYEYLIGIYLFFFLGNFLVPTVVNKIGAKWSLVLGSFLYPSFTLSMILLPDIYHWVIMVIAGFSASLIWSSKAIYVTDMSEQEKLPMDLALFNCIYNGMVGLSLVITGIVAMNLDMSLYYASGIGYLGTIMMMLLPNSDVPKTNVRLPLFSRLSISIGFNIACSIMVTSLVMTKVNIMAGDHKALVSSLLYLISMFCSVYIGSKLKRSNYQMVSKLVCFLTVVGLILLTFSDEHVALLYLSTTLLGFGRMGFELVSSVSIGYFVPKTDLIRMGSAYTMWLTVGMIVGVVCAKFLGLLYLVGGMIIFCVVSTIDLCSLGDKNV